LVLQQHYEQSFFFSSFFLHRRKIQNPSSQHTISLSFIDVTHFMKLHLSLACHCLKEGILPFDLFKSGSGENNVRRTQSHQQFRVS
jgi:hypothetical protein